MKPEDILPDDINHTVLDGVRVRKGSVGAFIANARTFLDPASSDEARRDAERDLLALVPAVRAVGLFDLFELRDPRLRALIENAR
ncbi:hypothetical protein LZC95_53320 [Pendulispora brunnea]|uniref:Preprotein translocase subunit SecD n=1 Tax=Pendulispora brunnea TaxID=2905690 RepID=A0ABZ2K919_9BACT